MNILMAVYSTTAKNQSKSLVLRIKYMCLKSTATFYITFNKVLKPKIGRKYSVIVILKIETPHMEGDCTVRVLTVHNGRWPTFIHNRNCTSL